MAQPGNLTRIVLYWREFQEQLQKATPEDLCQDHPELLPEVRRRLAALKNAQQVLHQAEAGPQITTDFVLAKQAELQTPASFAANQETGETVDHVPRDVNFIHSPGAPAPRQIAGYEILGELGRGGMGVVYKARQPGLNRLVALKMILRAEHASEHEKQRFIREAESIAQAQHPNIVQIHEIGEYQGLPFFSLEFVQGGSLEDRLNGTAIPSHEAAQILEVLARGMHFAHQQNIIHRDLKPANVLITEDGILKITDFGLAKKLDDVGLTETGAVVGTPSYLSPEQANGKSELMSPAVDVYALGVILYECLTGRPPFQAATVMDTLLQVIADEPVSPSQHVKGIPRDLETICMRCLEKSPARRYTTALDLAEDLQRFQQGKPVQARPVGRLSRFWRTCQRHPVVSGLLLTVFVLLVSGLTFSVRLIHIARRETSAAVQAKHQESQARQLESRARRDAENAATLEKQARQKADRSAHLAKVSSYATSLALVHQQIRLGEWQEARTILQQLDPALRNWEHEFLVRQTRKLLQDVQAHPESVLGLAVSSDGRRFLTAGYEFVKATKQLWSELKVWDSETGELIDKLRLKTQFFVSAADLSPDGTQVVFHADFTGTMMVWRLGNKKVLPLLQGHSRKVAEVRFTDDGTRIVSAGLDRTVRIWDAQTYKELMKFQTKSNVANIALTSDGTRVVTSNFNRVVKLWDVGTGKELFALPAAEFSIEGVGLSGDGTVLVVGHDRSSRDAELPGTVEIWDLNTRERRFILRQMDGGVTSVAITKDGRRVLAGVKHSPGAKVYLYNADTGMKLQAFPTKTSSVEHLAFDAGGKVALSGGVRGQVRLWDVRPREEAWALENVTAATTTVKGNSIFVSSLGGPLRELDASTGVVRRSWTLPNGIWLNLSFSQDGGRGAVGNLSGPVQVVDWNRKTVLFTSKEKTRRSLKDVALSPDGKVLATIGEYPEPKKVRIKLWNAETGKELRTLIEGETQFDGLTFSPDGKRLLAAGGFKFQGKKQHVPGVLQIWDVGSGKSQKLDQTMSQLFIAPVFSLDGKHVAVGTEKGTIQIRDATTGRQLLEMQGHTDEVTCLTYSPDGERLVSGSRDRTVKIWSADTGHNLLTLRGHSSAMKSVHFVSEGRRLVSQDHEGGLKVWSTLLK